MSIFGGIILHMKIKYCILSKIYNIYLFNLNIILLMILFFQMYLLIYFIFLYLSLDYFYWLQWWRCMELLCSLFKLQYSPDTYLFVWHPHPGILITDALFFHWFCCHLNVFLGVKLQLLSWKFLTLVRLLILYVFSRIIHPLGCESHTKHQWKIRHIFWHYKPQNHYTEFLYSKCKPAWIVFSIHGSTRDLT